jgi:hypothetical protein
MNSPIKTLFYGIACAALISAAGYSNTFRLESTLHELELECVGQGKLGSKFGEPLTLVCDPESIVNSSGSSNAIQAKIVQIQHEVLSSKEWPYLLALSVFLLFTVPLLWNILFKGIRELIYVVGK